MPIRPENRKRYPPNWKQISADAKERAGHQCEFCGVEQYAVGWRDEEGRFRHAAGSAYYDQMMYAETYHKACEARDHLNEWEESKYIVIVLTVAHLDHQPENCEPENLRALCQKCHLDYDKQHHAASRIKNSRCNLTIDMFEGTNP